MKKLAALTQWFFTASVAVIWLAANVLALVRNQPLADIPVWYHLLAAALFAPNLIAVLWRKRNGNGVA